ncbi:DNA primase [Patescibacteria group bacterium]|nr:DNA primase [Patescibacteria group bacterium]
MPSDTAHLVKEKLDIVAFLRNYVDLKPAGKNFKAQCPFHKEKTASFMVSPERQTWHCFGTCNEGGDIISFLMKYENIEFYDALKILAEKAGVELHAAGDRDYQASQTLYQLMAAAKEFFVSQLKQAPKIKEYLHERGLADATIEEFEIGVAPDTSDALIKYLVQKRFTVADIERAGLALKTERGTYWDRFRARIMFPIHNQIGKTVAFTGRVLPWNNSENVGKYVNSPETPIFQKSKVLYGFDKTKGEIRQVHRAVVVEGQMDLIMAWQDGIKNIVATSGTALTNDHLVLLSRLADELVLSFDADAAGQAAAERAIDLANAADLSVKLLLIDDPKLKDPADMARERPGHLAQLVAAAKPAMEYYFHKYMAQTSADRMQKKQQIRLVLGKIRMLASPIERSEWLKELSYITKINEEVLVEEMAALPTTAPAPAPRTKESAAPVITELNRREKIIQRLIGILLYLKSDVKALKDFAQYVPDKYAAVYRSFTVPDAERSEEIKELMAAISMKFGFENQGTPAPDLEKEVGLLLRELKREYLKERREALSDQITMWERSGDQEKLAAAMTEYAAVARELQGL